jgi:hypothetical protein
MQDKTIFVSLTTLYDMLCLFVSHLGGVVFVAMGIEVCVFVDVGVDIANLCDPISFPVSLGAL